MTLNSDFEQVFAQGVVLLFAFAILFIIYCLMFKIDRQLRRTENRVKKSRVRMNTLTHQQMPIWQKVLSEITNHHHYSILASYLKQPFNGRLQHNSDSINLAQKLPKLLPNLDNAFLPESGLTVLSFGMNEGNGPVTLEKKDSTKELTALQTKIYETRGVGPREDHKEPETENTGGKGQISKQKCNKNSFARNDLKSLCLLKRNEKQCSQTNFTKYNINKTHLKKSITVKERPATKCYVKQKQNNSNQNKQQKPLNNVKRVLPSKVQDVKVYLLSQTLDKASPSSQKLCPIPKNRDKYLKPTKKLNYNCLDSEKKSDLNLKEEPLEVSTTNKKKSIIKKDKTRGIAVIRCTKIIDERQVSAEARPKFVFKVDLSFCIKHENLIHKLNKRCESKTLETFGQIEKGMTSVRSKYCKTKLKQVIHSSRNFVLKIPIKFQNKQNILKFIFCFIVRKGNKHAKKNVSGVMRNQMRTHLRHFVSLNRCRLKQIPKLCNKAYQTKRFNLYTNSDPRSFQSLQPIHEYHKCEPFLIVDFNTVYNDEELKNENYLFNHELRTDPYYSLENKGLGMDKSIHEFITNQYNDLIMNSLTNDYTFFQRYSPYQTYEVNNIRTVLSTILEDPAEENCELLNKIYSETESDVAINFREVEIISKKTNSTKGINEEVLFLDGDVTNTIETEYPRVIGKQHLHKKSNDTLKIQKSTIVISENTHETILNEEGCSKNVDYVTVGKGNDDSKNLYFSTKIVDSLQKIEVVKGNDQTETIQMSKSVTYIFRQKDLIDSSDDGSIQEESLCDLETTIEHKSISCGRLTVKSAVLNLSDQCKSDLLRESPKNSSLFILRDTLVSLPNHAKSDNELNEKQTANDLLGRL